MGVTYDITPPNVLTLGPTDDWIFPGCIAYKQLSLDLQAE